MADDPTPSRPTDATDATEARGTTGGSPPPGPAVAPGGREVTRSVDLDAGTDEVWRAVSDPDERALWLDDPDAAVRRVRVDESAPGERLVWTWWHPGDEGDASTVTVELRPVDGGGTRVVVTEATPAPLPVVRASAGVPGSAAGVLTGLRPAPTGRRTPGWVRCLHDRWDARLLGLELMFVAARAGVA